jgi:2-methylcitrate dehydratase
MSTSTTERTRCTTEALAEWVVKSDQTDLGDSVPMLMRRNILDSLGCAIAALDGETVQVVRDTIATGGGGATLIGGGRTSVDQATLFNSIAVRYVDLLDTYLTPGGLCHPADNFGAILAVAESAGATGDEFVLALAVAYEVQCRFSAAVPVMARGLNHALQLAMSVAAGAAKLLDLSAEQTANAIAIAAADNVSLAAIHSEPVSNWKGISPGITAQRAVYTTALAKRGITGPLGLFEGPNGLEQLFGQRIDLRLGDRALDVVKHTHLKKYCSLIHGQAPIETVLALAKERGIDHEDVESVDAEVFQTDVRPNTTFTAGYPQSTPVRIGVTLRGGQRFSREQHDFEGAPGRPLTWDRTVEKFHWLAEQYAEQALRDEIVDRVEHLGVEPVSELALFLGDVSPVPRLPKTRRPV